MQQKRPATIAEIGNGGAEEVITAAAVTELITSTLFLPSFLPSVRYTHVSINDA